LGDLEGRFVYPGTTRDSKRGHWKQHVSLYGGSVRGTWRVGSFTGNPEGYGKKGSGNGHLSPYRPHSGDQGGDAALLGTLRER